MNCILKFINGSSVVKWSTIIFLVIIIFIVDKTNAYSNNPWQLVFQPRQRIVKTIGIYNEQIFIGTGNGVQVSNDSGNTWQDFGSSQLEKDASGNCLINWISIDEDSKKIYIATSFGAYYSRIDKPTWEKIFLDIKALASKNDLTTDESNDDLLNEEIDPSISGNNEDDNLSTSEINSITQDKKNIYLSTNDGFWTCSLEKNLCNRLNNGLEPDNVSGNYEVFYSLKHDDDFFLATSSGIYVFNKTSQSWQNISNGIQKLPNNRIDIRYLFIDKEQNLWAASGTGIYLSDNKGENWEKVSNGIIKNNEGFQEVFYLFESDKKLYAACASGIYYFDKKENSWQDITYGIRTKENNKTVYWVVQLNDNFFAATDEGLFVTYLSSLITEDTNEKTNYEKQETGSQIILKGKIETEFANLKETEPSVQEVQKQALKFASLPTTNDYKRYRAQVRLRNLIPRISFDINSTGTSTNYYQLDKGIATDVSLNNKFDADSTSKFQHDGRAFKQVSVLWNTNQFLYDDETWRILNQARLTANIKENLLDDVTKIYFQRKKLQLDNLISPQEDNISKLSKELEIAELTGQLDSRTGGWFSKEIEKRRKPK